MCLNSLLYNKIDIVFMLRGMVINCSGMLTYFYVPLCLLCRYFNRRHLVNLMSDHSAPNTPASSYDAQLSMHSPTPVTHPNALSYDV